jgi:RNA polymerase sigma-70 factor (ECF subfamily)
MRLLMEAWPAPAPAVADASGRGAAPPDLAALFRAHGAAVSRWVARLGGPGADVEDLVQEVFLVVHRRLGEFRGDARVTTWLYEIAIRVVQARRRRARLSSWWQRRHAVAAEPPPEVATPLDELERRRRAEMVYQLLDRLPEAERTALILFELEGLSGQRIAELTGASLANVWVRVHRARARFTTMFLRWEQGEDR